MKKHLLFLTMLGCVTASAQNDPSAIPGDTGTVKFIYGGVEKTYVTVRGDDGKIWLQQNLGSSAVATAYNDTAGYGHTFQWGRWDDGHQLRNSTAALASTLSQNNPAGIPTGSPLFYRGPNPADWWGNGGANDTWSANAPSATNGKDPCTAIAPNWRLPTEAEWTNLVAVENISDRPSAFASNLKLTAAGMREPNVGNLLNVGQYGQYWASTPSGVYAKNLTVGDVFINASDDAYRSYGFSVRCVTATCTGAPQPDSIQGGDSVCQGSTQTFSVLPTPNTSASGYAWTVPSGWSITGGSGTNTITVLVGASGGNISVTASNNCDTSVARSMPVAVKPAPVPVLVLNGNVLSTSTPFTSYIWKRNDTVIAGANSQTYTVTVDGSYTVTVTGSNGCSGTSTPLVTTLSVADVAQSSGIRIYPNPASGLVHIDAPQPVNAAVYSMDGKLVMELKRVKELNTSRLQPGTYLIRVTTVDGMRLKEEQLVITAR